MAKKPETVFRESKVRPFLVTLRSGMSHFPIQQVAIVGDADFICCAQGKFVWLELKSMDGEPSKLQTFKAQWVRETGGITLRVDPANWHNAKRILTALARGENYDQDDLQECL